MRVYAIETQETYRLDRFIVRIFGQYSQYYQDVLRYFNPLVDFIDLKAGTLLRVPNEIEIRAVQARGRYTLTE